MMSFLFFIFVFFLKVSTALFMFVQPESVFKLLGYATPLGRISQHRKFDATVCFLFDDQSAVLAYRFLTKS